MSPDCPTARCAHPDDPTRQMRSRTSLCVWTVHLEVFPQAVRPVSHVNRDTSRTPLSPRSVLHAAREVRAIRRVSRPRVLLAPLVCIRVVRRSPPVRSVPRDTSRTCQAHYRVSSVRLKSLQIEPSVWCMRVRTTTSMMLPLVPATHALSGQLVWEHVRRVLPVSTLLSQGHLAPLASMSKGYYVAVASPVSHLGTGHTW